MFYQRIKCDQPAPDERCYDKGRKGEREKVQQPARDRARLAIGCALLQHPASDLERIHLVLHLVDQVSCLICPLLAARALRAANALGSQCARF